MKPTWEKLGQELLLNVGQKVAQNPKAAAATAVATAKAVGSTALVVAPYLAVGAAVGLGVAWLLSKS